MDELYGLSSEELERRLLGAVGGNTWPPVHEALALAKEKHAGQLRKDGTEFIRHPLRVALLLLEVGGIDQADMLCAALLHDLVEDTEVDIFEVEDRFGHKVGDLVRALTLPPLESGQSAHQQAMGHFQHLSWEGRDPQILRSADRLDNVKTLAGSLTPQREAEYLKETREGLLPLTLACNTGLYHALDQALQQAGCPAA